MHASRAFHSRGPVVERSTSRYLRLVDADGLGNRQVVGFEHEVLWLRSAEAQVVVVNPAGEVVSHGSLNDDVWYGFLSCLGDLYGEAAETVAGFGVTPEGPLAVEIRLTVRDGPVLPAVPDPYSSNRPPCYMACPGDWIDHRDAALAELWAIGGSGAEWESIRLLSPVALLDAEAIWTSRNQADPDAADALLNAVMERALDRLPADEARATWTRVERARRPDAGEEAA